MVADLLRKQVYRPEALRLLLADALGRRHPVLSTSRHLDEAAQWILRAQSGTGDDGVIFGCAYFVVRAMHVVLFTQATPHLAVHDAMARLARTAIPAAVKIDDSFSERGH